jgi:glycosyltransferase involved in cell wall biosynthesis
MLSPISTILHRTTRGNRKLNILTFPTHERYQTGFADTNANFYLFQGKGIKDWKDKYAPLPKNHFLLNGNLGDKQIPIDIQFDLILSQNKFGQFGIAQQLSRALHVPLVSLEHTLPVTGWHYSTVDYMKTLKGDVNIFISEYSRDKWGWSDEDAIVIHHGVDTELFNATNNSRENVVLSVVNDWINRDWCCNFSGWRRITAGLPVKVFGDTPGLSLPTENPTQLAKEYANARIFLNTSTVSPVPTALMEAMSAGCAVVSTSNCMIPEIITDGINGFISNDENTLRARIITLMEKPELAAEMGQKARQTIIDRFSMDKFVKNWDSVLEEASHIVYKGI